MILALAATCLVIGHAPFTRPDTGCTPGSAVPLTTGQVCRPKDRPDLTAAERRSIVTRYGVPDWSGDDGELDHRVPVFLGGRTSVFNVWPERGPIPNPKDRLEAYVRHRICVEGSMRPATARKLFRGNWVTAYRRYIG